MGVTGAGFALYYGLQGAGVDPIWAGNIVQLTFVLGLTVAWVGSYVSRVMNKDMTYVKQLKDYEDAVMAKRLEELPEAELEKMKARATRFGLPPPTMDDVRAKNPHKVSDKKVSDNGAVDKGYVDDEETVVVPVADKHTMSRVIGKKRSVLSMMCKVADCSMIVGNKEMAVRVRCADAVRRAHAVALLDGRGDATIPRSGLGARRPAARFDR